jgi:hypothetical protein
VLRIGHCLLDGRAVDIFQRVKNGCLLRPIEILDEVDDVIGIKFPDCLGQLLGREEGDYLFTQALIEVGQDVAIDNVGGKQKYLSPLARIDLFEEVSDVRRMQRLEDRVKPRCVCRRDGKPRRGEQAFGERVILLPLLGPCSVKVGHGHLPLAPGA